METYHLPDHVHATIADGRIVFIDFKADEYFALPANATPIAKILTTDREISPQSSLATDAERTTLLEIISIMKSKGILRPGALNNAVPSLTISQPKYDLSDGFLLATPHVTPSILIKFLHSLFLAIIGRKITGMYHLTRHIARFKVQNKHLDHSLKSIVYIFRYIRSFFYTASDHCYFDCAVLLYFLKLHGFDGKWVFGAKFDPFKAHCWVQVDDTIVSCYLTEIITFYPIASI